MAFVAFIGRLLFASIFILSAWQQFNEFSTDGGPSGNALKPKFAAFSRHVRSSTGISIPQIDISSLVATTIGLKSLGGFLFIFGSSFGAYLLVLHQAVVTPIVYDFYNYEGDNKEFGPLFVKFTQNLALLGALLFFVGMKNTSHRRPGLRKKNPKTKVG